MKMNDCITSVSLVKQLSKLCREKKCNCEHFNPDNIEEHVKLLNKPIDHEAYQLVKYIIPYITGKTDLENKLVEEKINSFIKKENGILPIDFTLLISILYYVDKYGEKVIFGNLLKELTIQYFVRIQENCKVLNNFVVVTPCDDIININITMCTWLLLKIRYNKIIKFLFKNKLITKIQSLYRSYRSRRFKYNIKKYLCNLNKDNLSIIKKKNYVITNSFNISIIQQTFRTYALIKKINKLACLHLKQTKASIKISKFMYKYLIKKKKFKVLDIYKDDINNSKYASHTISPEARHIAYNLHEKNYKTDYNLKLRLLNYFWKYNLKYLKNTLYMDLILWYCVIFFNKKKINSPEYMKKYVINYYLIAERKYNDNNHEFYLPSTNNVVSKIKRKSLDSNINDQKIKNIGDRYDRIFLYEFQCLTSQISKSVKKTEKKSSYNTNNVKNDTNIIKYINPELLEHVDPTLLNTLHEIGQKNIKIEKSKKKTRRNKMNNKLTKEELIDKGNESLKHMNKLLKELDEEENRKRNKPKPKKKKKKKKNRKKDTVLIDIMTESSDNIQDIDNDIFIEQYKKKINKEFSFYTIKKKVIPHLIFFITTHIVKIKNNYIKTEKKRQAKIDKQKKKDDILNKQTIIKKILLKRYSSLFNKMKDNINKYHKKITSIILIQSLIRMNKIKNDYSQFKKIINKKIKLIKIDLKLKNEEQELENLEKEINNTNNIFVDYIDHFFNQDYYSQYTDEFCTNPNNSINYNQTLNYNYNDPYYHWVNIVYQGDFFYLNRITKEKIFTPPNVSYPIPIENYNIR